MKTKWEHVVMHNKWHLWILIHWYFKHMAEVNCFRTYFRMNKHFIFSHFKTTNNWQWLNDLRFLSYSCVFWAVYDKFIIYSEWNRIYKFTVNGTKISNYLCLCRLFVVLTQCWLFVVLTRCCNRTQWNRYSYTWANMYKVSTIFEANTMKLIFTSEHIGINSLQLPEETLMK